MIYLGGSFSIYLAWTIATVVGIQIGALFIAMLASCLVDKKAYCTVCVAGLTLLKKHIHQRDIATLTDWLATLLMADYLSSPQVMALIHYLLQAGESADSEAFVREMA